MGIKARVSIVNYEDTHWPGRDHDILTGRKAYILGSSSRIVLLLMEDILRKIDLLTHNNS